MDLTFHVPMQYYSFQHRTLLSPPGTSSTGCNFHFDSASSFSLELFLQSSPVTYWTPVDLRGSSSNVISFCLFIWFSILVQGKISEVVYHSLLQWTMFCQLFTMTCLVWIALQDMVHSFIELHKAVSHVIILVYFL